MGGGPRHFGYRVLSLHVHFVSTKRCPGRGETVVELHGRAGKPFGRGQKAAFRRRVVYIKVLYVFFAHFWRHRSFVSGRRVCFADYFRDHRRF